MFTGILLAVSRAMGETAPLMLTALGCATLNFDPLHPTSAVPLLIWGVLQRSEPRRPDLGLLAAAADPNAGAEYHCQTNRCKMENLKLQINDLSVAYTPENWP